MFQLKPTGSNAEDRSTGANHVERGDDLCQQGRAAVGIAGHQRAQLQPLGRRGQRTKGRVGLQHRLVGRPQHGQLVEVVHHKQGVVTSRFGLTRLSDDGREKLLHPVP